MIKAVIHSNWFSVLFNCSIFLAITTVYEGVIAKFVGQATPTVCMFNYTVNVVCEAAGHYWMVEIRFCSGGLPSVSYRYPAPCWWLTWMQCISGQYSSAIFPLKKKYKYVLSVRAERAAKYVFQKVFLFNWCGYDGPQSQTVLNLLERSWISSREIHLFLFCDKSC